MGQNVFLPLTFGECHILTLRLGRENLIWKPPIFQTPSKASLTDIVAFRRKYSSSLSNVADGWWASMALASGPAESFYPRQQGFSHLSVNA